MKKAICSIVVLCFPLTAIGQSNPAQVPQPPQVTVIRAGTLIDPRTNEPKHNQVIVIRGDKIEAVGDAASAQIPAGAKVIDLSNATVLPGPDRVPHSHLSAGRGPRNRRLRYPAAEVPAGVPRGARDGFGATRAGAGLHHHSRYGDRGRGLWRCRNQDGGGRRLHSGAADLHDDARHFHHRRLSAGRLCSGDSRFPRESQIIDGPVEARKAAREQLDHGADWIKVYMTHRSWTDKDGHLVSQPTLTVEELQADRGRSARLGAQSRLPRL